MSEESPENLPNESQPAENEMSESLTATKTDEANVAKDDQTTNMNDKEDIKTDRLQQVKTGIL